VFLVTTAFQGRFLGGCAEKPDLLGRQCPGTVSAARATPVDYHATFLSYRHKFGSFLPPQKQRGQPDHF
jgi:hypothetical protein